MIGHRVRAYQQSRRTPSPVVQDFDDFCKRQLARVRQAAGHRAANAMVRLRNAGVHVLVVETRGLPQNICTPLPRACREALEGED